MPANPQKNKFSTIEFIAIFVIVVAGLSYLFPEQFGRKSAAPANVRLSMEDTTVTMGNDPVILIHNETDKDLVLPKRCPQPPVAIAYISQTSDGGEERSDLMANQSVLPCVDLTVVPAKNTVTVSLAPWKYALFERVGTYEASLDLPDTVKQGTGAQITTGFSMVEPGFFVKTFRTFITKPLFNALIFIGSYMPGHNLGLAIIVLTILVKLILLVPNQHALEGQKKLQQLQPRLDELKRKYPDDPKRVQEETMKLWKEMKINPLQSCLPTLLQFPILIGLFFVIKNGVSVEISQHLLYAFYHDLPANFLGNTFLGMDLIKPSVIVFPPMLVALQYIQMKMMMSKQKPKNTEIVVKPVGKTSWIPEMNQQTVMMYVLPLMIGFFAITFPAAVSLYWGISTVFGIVQQWFVMKK